MSFPNVPTQLFLIVKTNYLVPMKQVSGKIDQEDHVVAGYTSFSSAQRNCKPGEKVTGPFPLIISREQEDILPPVKPPIQPFGPFNPSIQPKKGGFNFPPPEGNGFFKK